jgi:hypothetical protein
MVAFSLCVQFFTLCAAVITLVTVNVNRRRLDMVIGNSSQSLDVRLSQLTQSYDEMAHSVAELEIAVTAIIEKIE